MNLWHTLRRETIGAWRSVRYDLDHHRTAKLAGAFTEEFDLPADRERGPSRLIPLTGVALLLLGGLTGAVLAIGGGLAVLGTDAAPPFADQPGGTATQQPGTVPAVGTTQSPRPLTPRRPGTRLAPAPTVGTGTAPAPDPTPVLEGSTLPASPTVSSSSPAPSTSASPSASIERSRSRGPRSRR